MESGIFGSAPLSMIDLNPAYVFAGMLLAFALNFVLAKIACYANKSNSVNSNSNLCLCMVLLGTVVSLIMSVIGNSLARAFGAIGALSLIRFRTAVKDPLDLVELFMAISVGMTTGSGHFIIACGAAAIFGIFLAVSDFLPLKKHKNEVCMLKLEYEAAPEVQSTLFSIIKPYVIEQTVLSEETTENAKNAEVVLELTCASAAELTPMLSKLKEANSSVKAQIITA